MENDTLARDGICQKLPTEKHNASEKWLMLPGLVSRRYG